jgi:apolipoprotein N-acyltransferase
MNVYGGLSLPLAVLVFVLFVAVFAFHTALFALVLRRFMERWGARGLWLAAPLWVAIELLQSGIIFGGFPWMLAGYALVPFAGLLQIVPWTGIYGLSFVLVGVNAVLALALRRRDPILAGGAMVLVTALVLVPAPVGEEPQEGSFRVRIVQTHIPIDYPWGGAEEASLLDELGALSAAGSGAGEPGPDLLVWPETPGPFRLAPGAGFRLRMEALARELDAHVLVGYIDFRDEMPTNSAGLLSPEGDQVSRYDKIHLVPFGEYVPLRRVFFFAESLVRQVGDFAPGTEYTISPFRGRRIAATICYEDVFPALMRQFTRRGAQAIVNITNDGWFGSSSAPYQHLRMAIVRAVENRRYLIRAANTGISAVIDPYGRVVSATALGERTTLEGVVGYRTDLTFYVRFGNVFALTAALATLVGLWIAHRHRKEGSGDIE